MTRMPRLFLAFLGGPSAVGISSIRLIAVREIKSHGWHEIQQATSGWGRTPPAGEDPPAAMPTGVAHSGTSCLIGCPYARVVLRLG
jgi:hypothetical protein